LVDLLLYSRWGNGSLTLNENFFLLGDKQEVHPQGTGTRQYEEHYIIYMMRTVCVFCFKLNKQKTTEWRFFVDSIRCCDIRKKVERRTLTSSNIIHMKNSLKYFVGGAGILLIFTGGITFDWGVVNTWLYTVQMPFLGVLQVFAGIALLAIALSVNWE
jgi:hypothetical protein